MDTYHFILMFRSLSCSTTLPNLFICHAIVTKVKIYAPKGLGNSDAVDFESMWTVLSSSLREIHTKNASMLSFEELYRNAYKLVLKKKGESLYLRVQAFEEDWLVNEIRPRILAVISPSLLSRHGAADTTTAIEKRVAGETLLRALKQAWEDHNLCMNMTTDVLMYMVSIPKSFPATSAELRRLEFSAHWGRNEFIVSTIGNHQSFLPRWDNFGTMFSEQQCLPMRT